MGGLDACHFSSQPAPTIPPPMQARRRGVCDEDQHHHRLRVQEGGVPPVHRRALQPAGALRQPGGACVRAMQLCDPLAAARVNRSCCDLTHLCDCFPCACCLFACCLLKIAFLPTTVSTPAGGSPRLPGRAGPHPVCRGRPDAGGGVPGRHICCSGHLLLWFCRAAVHCRTVWPSASAAPVCHAAVPGAAHSGPAHLLFWFATQLCGAAHSGPACRRASRARPAYLPSARRRLFCLLRRRLLSSVALHLPPPHHRTPCPSPPTSCPMAAWSCCLRAARAAPTAPLRPRRRWPLARLSRCGTTCPRGGQQADADALCRLWGMQVCVVDHWAVGSAAVLK